MNKANSQKTNIHALLPAAGSGQRFGGPVPKQYMKLAGKPIIQHSLECLFQVVDRVTVAIADDDDYWHQLDIAKDERIQLVSGGQTRSESVNNALAAIKNAHKDDWVLIHDAVRPLVRVADIEKLIVGLSEHENGGLLALPVFDTVKRANMEAAVISTEDREGLWLAQTPQLFRYGRLLNAFKVAARDAPEIEITDEALAMEVSGQAVKLIEGCRSNIKITRMADLEFAELILGSASVARHDD